MSNLYPEAASYGGGLGQALIGPMARRRGGRRRGRARLTLDEWAQQQAQRFIDAQIKGIEEQRNIYLEELRRQSELEAQRGLALGQALAAMNMPGRVQGIFGGAAGDIAGLAGGFSEGIRNQAAAEAAEGTRMVSGTGQEGAVRNEGVGMADVNYGTWGYIPGRSLTETGAGFAAQAALEPSFAARIGQLEAGRVHSEGLRGLDQFTEALIEARSGRPELVEKFRAMREDERGRAWEQRFEMMKWQADQHYRNYMLALERGDRKIAMRELALAQRKQRQAEREANRRYDLDVRTENRLQAEAARGAKGGGLTATQRAAQLEKATMFTTSDEFKEAMEQAFANTELLPGDPANRRKLIEDRLFRRFAGAFTTPTAKKALRAAIREAVQAWGRGSGAPGSSGSDSGSSYDEYR